MNLVTLRRGEGLYVPAGVLHAYQDGLGVEIMAASDNVLRRGLTPKHINAGELVRLVDPRPGMPPLLRPSAEGGVARFETPALDFALTRVTVGAPTAADGSPTTPGTAVSLPVRGVAIVLATAGAITVAGDASGERETIAPGTAVLVTPDEGAVRLAGVGEVFIAQPGAEANAAPAV
jgi:mannose-6-phosphate isomerase